MPFFLIEHLSPKISVHFTDSHPPLHLCRIIHSYRLNSYRSGIKHSSKLYSLKALQVYTNARVSCLCQFNWDGRKY